MSIKAKKSKEQAPAPHWTTGLREASDLRLSFNLSFISGDKHFSLQNENLDYHALMEKMEQLSTRTLVSLLNLPKKTGLEQVTQRRINGRLRGMPVPDSFGETRKRIASDKLTIVRFNSQHSRLIGKLIDQTFYIFWIDCNHELYHG